MMQTMAEIQRQEPSCPACWKITTEPRYQGIVLISSEDFMKTATGKIAHVTKKKRTELKKEKVNEFLKYINVLLNEGWGFLAVHTADPHLLGLFDEAVNKLMLGLISDDTFFHDNFERFNHDANHIIFRILPRKRPPSTVVFNTKVTTDAGLADPSHGQMRNFIHAMSKRGEQKQTYKEQLVRTFRLNAEVDVRLKNSPTQIMFQEDMETQAKSIPVEEGADFIKKLISFCFEDIRLHRYVSAFSKLPRGGSVFLGVYEEKTEILKWETVEDHELKTLLEKMGGQDKTFILYKDVDTEDLYHIMSNKGRVPTKDQQKTGQFKALGITIKEEDKDKLKEGLTNMIRNNMLFFPFIEEASDCIDVKFHAVEGTPTESCEDRYVVEVRVGHDKGIWYTDPSGPIAYELKETDDGRNIERIDVASWHELNRKCVAED